MSALAIIAIVSACFASLVGIPALLEERRLRQKRRERMPGGADGGASSRIGRNIRRALSDMSAFRAGADERECTSREFPRMLDVIGLGLQAGLSFDQAFSLYIERFDTHLSKRCRIRCAGWLSGLEERESALRGLADELGTTAFRRFADLTAFALQFGVSLAPLLESLADDARKENTARLQERVLKAGTKMLVPTGIFILPAMLLLVMGPAILQMAEQFL